MIRAMVVIRELNRQNLDFWLPFDLPEVPKVGDYISIFRPDSTTHTEDVIVRHVWWHLHSPEEATVVRAPEPKVGKVQDVLIECDVALGPSARNNWRTRAEAAEKRGATIERFEIERFIVPESD